MTLSSTAKVKGASELTKMSRALFLLLFASVALAQSAIDLFWQAQESEKKGDLVRAYALYTQASFLEPRNKEYRGRSLALESKVRSNIKLDLTAKKELDETKSPPDLGPKIETLITDHDLEEVKRLLPPPDLTPAPGRRDFRFELDAQPLWEQVAKTFGLEIVFDGDYGQASARQPIRFQMEQTEAREALHALQLATGSFAIPLGPKLLFVARDTPQKRQEQERTMAIAVPIPEPFTVQEAQELARSVQQVMELQKFAVDGTRRMVFMRGPVSKVKPALALFEDFAMRRAQVVIEIELFELSNSSSLNLGLNLPASSQLVNFGATRIFRNFLRAPLRYQNYLAFGGGASLIGLGIANAQLFASMSYNAGTTLYKGEVRTLDTAPAQLHVGDKYPIITQQYVGGTGATGAGFGGIGGFAPPPQIQFQDLGLTIKVTPRIHNADEVSLKLESEFKVLTGQVLNGIPVIANRSYNGEVRLRDGEWAIVAGLLTMNETKSNNGIPWIRDVPGLSDRTREQRMGNTLLVIKPRVVTLPPSETFSTRGIWVGTESRLRLPL